MESMRWLEPPSRYGVVYAVALPANTRVAATTSPGADSGVTTPQNVRVREAPRPRAASSSPGSTWATAE
ncbi:hypothetical protein GCM10025875_20400 [Litorihabitans aurantiacus]|uniref:Uncharacterized protein n=1 Tax=Litorihabitans aurantiacus TaxID=1930061 RepID=A0AA38CPX6_9MICO|nr:hypothetical protein GCM10025875_20400 [Litorihabitans aurantiacus]